MIDLTQNIYIKADINKIWAYLTDFSNSLNFNRFHTKLDLPSNYSLAKIDKFKINHNFVKYLPFCLWLFSKPYRLNYYKDLTTIFRL